MAFSGGVEVQASESRPCIDCLRADTQLVTSHVQNAQPPSSCNTSSEVLQSLRK